MVLPPKRENICLTGASANQKPYLLLKSVYLVKFMYTTKHTHLQQGHIFQIHKHKHFVLVEFLKIPCQAHFEISQ